MVTEATYRLICKDWVILLEQIKVCRCFIVLFCSAAESQVALCSMLTVMSKHLPGIHLSLQHSLLLESSRQVICFLNLQGRKWCSGIHFSVLLKCMLRLCLRNQTKPNEFRRFVVKSVFTHLLDYFKDNTDSMIVILGLGLVPKFNLGEF